MEGTGSSAREPDNQEREEMLESLNSDAEGGADVQSISDRQASVSGRKQGHSGGAVSSRTRKKLTVSLTGGQKGMAKKQKKAKSRKPRGVKTSGSGGTKTGSVSGVGKARGTARLFPEPRRKPEDTNLSDDSFKSSESLLGACCRSQVLLWRTSLTSLFSLR